MSNNAFFVKVAWDDEAQVWFIKETDFPGLAAEADTIEALQAKVGVLVQDLYEDNKHLIDWVPNDGLPYHFMAEQNSKVRIAG